MVEALLLETLKINVHYYFRYCHIIAQGIETYRENFGRNIDFVTELFANQPVECLTKGEEQLTEDYHCIMDGAKVIFADSVDALVKNG